MPTNLSEWIKNCRQNVSEEPTRGLFKSLYYLYVASFLTVSSHYPLGTNVFNKEWDLLIILDACRVDAIQALEGEYDFINNVNSIWSVGSTSEEWMSLTFREDYINKIRETAYISGNPYIDRVFHQNVTPPADTTLPFGPSDYNVVNPGEFYMIDDVCKYGVDESKNVVPAEVMTDRAIKTGREENAKRQIVHYMQPHAPYLGDTEIDNPVFERFISGDISKSKVWDGYLDNLRYVLDQVEILLKNIDAEKVVITADHGEMFGEWSFYDHTVACPHPSVRKVPWIETKSNDSGTFDPSVEPEDVDDDFDRRQHLENLGYL